MNNIITIVTVVVVAAAGVYLFTQRDAAQLVFLGDTSVSPEVLANTQLFMERSALLTQLNIDTSLFTDPRFTTLSSFATRVPSRPQGRTNPFEPPARGIE